MCFFSYIRTSIFFPHLTSVKCSLKEAGCLRNNLLGDFVCRIELISLMWILAHYKTTSSLLSENGQNIICPLGSREWTCAVLAVFAVTSVVSAD
jgi:hypothetical protein